MTVRPRFAVAAGARPVAEAAAEVLRSGGNAADAAICGALVACVAEPALASLYGGGFLMAREPSGKVGLLDFFVETPRRKAAFGEVDLREVAADFGAARQVFHIGAGSVATPGVPRGLVEAHRRLGRTPFHELAEPAIRLAKQGATLSAFQAEVLAIIAPIVAASPAALAIFGDGTAPLKAGALYRNEALADVLESFALEGDRFLHEGEPAQALAGMAGTHLTALDLRRYEARWREPLEEARGDWRLYLNSPPSLGGALIALALRLMRAEDGPAETALALEATARARIETALNRDAIAGSARLLAPDLVNRYAAELNGRRAAVAGTTHLSVIDGAGMAAALTLSNGSGSGVIVPGTGIMPNNMLGEEDLVGAAIEEWEPGVRLASMMAPTIATRENGAVLVLGSGGSARIRSALAQTLAHLIDREMRLEDAVAAPRLHTERWPEADFEDRIGEEARVRLLRAFPEARGWAADSMFFGGVHAARREAKGAVEAAADHRRDGWAITD